VTSPVPAAPDRPLSLTARPRDPARLARALLPALGLLWAWLLILVGLLSLLSWPERVPLWGRPLVVAGAVLVALGQFVLGLTATGLFPRADRRLALAWSVAAWLAVPLVILLGVLL